MLDRFSSGWPWEAWPRSLRMEPKRDYRQVTRNGQFTSWPAEARALRTQLNPVRALADGGASPSVLGMRRLLLYSRRLRSRQPLDQQLPTELRWLALSDWTVRPHCSGKTAIVGHTANLAGRIVDFGFLRCLDTGCGLGGCLTAMDILSGHQWHCSENSEKVVWE